MANPFRIVLASASRARQAMLQAAGIDFEVIPACINEDAIRSAIESEVAGADVNDVAGVLAEEKAISVSSLHKDALVIGSDQVLGLGKRIFSKAASHEEARLALQQLRGRQHELISAVTLAQNGEVLWSASESAQLTMRDFTDKFLGSYLEHAGNSILNSVGCYELEGLGVQLFEKIEGDYFTVLGMPLLPLLSELRRRGAIAV